MYAQPMQTVVAGQVPAGAVNPAMNANNAAYIAGMQQGQMQQAQMQAAMGMRPMMMGNGMASRMFVCRALTYSCTRPPILA
jgi:hypothetical protein